MWNTFDVGEMISIDFNRNYLGENYPQMIWLKYEAENQTSIDHLVQTGIDNGCQVNMQLVCAKAI